MQKQCMKNVVYLLKTLVQYIGGHNFLSSGTVAHELLCLDLPHSHWNSNGIIVMRFENLMAVNIK
jgi:hypothetical protein